MGANETRVESCLSHLPGSDGETQSTWFNGARALGVTVGLHPHHDPEGDYIIEYQVTLPK